MKVLLSFDKKRITDIEVQKLISNYYKSLTMVGVEVVFSEKDEYDLVHILESIDESLVYKFKERKKVPVIYNALSAISSDIFKHEKIKISASFRDCLNSVDAITVNWDSQKLILRHLDISAPIEIVPVGVDKDYFSQIEDIEVDAFRKYYLIDPERDFYICSARYEEANDLKMAASIARMIPSADFFLFGTIKEGNLLLMKNKKKPRNLHYENVLSFDLYKSAISQMKGEILFNGNMSSSAIVLDTMAVKKQIYTVNNTVLFDALIKQKNAIFFNTVEELFQEIRQSEEISTIAEGFEFSQKYNLLALGKRLKNLYEFYLSSKR